MKNDTAREARGKWRWILQQLNVPAIHLNGKHGKCPKCGGSDRFRYTDYRKNGDYFCNGCGTGDGFDLLMAIHGCDFATAAQMVDKLLRTSSPPEAEPFTPERDLERRRADLNRTWMAAKATSDIDLYLGRRGIDTDQLRPDFDQDLRWHTNLYLKEEDKKCPAMIALIRNQSFKPVSIHRTFMTGKHKKIMPPTENIRGAGIYLGDPESSEHIIIGEGIETVLSAMTLKHGLPGIAAISANGMESIMPPPNVKRVYVIGDNDRSFTGQKAAFTLARELDQHRIEAMVILPEAPDTDFNDYIRNQDNDDRNLISFSNRGRHGQ